MSSTLLNSPEPEAIDVEAEFRRLADLWYREAGLLSNLRKAYQHPAYQAIIALGPPVVPVLLRQLEAKPGWWFAALRELTGANPAAPEHCGKLDFIAADWVAWGCRNGYPT
jgi:hypothetical protein